VPEHLLDDLDVGTAGDGEARGRVSEWVPMSNTESR
jgi:hypothetical protein